MPCYRIHRIKEIPRENFRWASHTGGLTVVKPKDYDCSREVEAATPYAVWKFLQGAGDGLRPGDLLETVASDGTGRELQITKYIGFEPAQWYTPETRTETVPSVEFAPVLPANLSSEQQS
ncbi:MAG: hypothetical protein JO185_20905 [Acidobacteriaceae bacterium]|nr:hypothetical protein [Acidobacteriaceae bacterium]